MAIKIWGEIEPETPKKKDVILRLNVVCGGLDISAVDEKGNHLAHLWYLGKDGPSFPVHARALINGNGCDTSDFIWDEDGALLRMAEKGE